MNKSNEQQIQEKQYEFPYHYIPGVEGKNFTQSKTLRWGYEYLAYLEFVCEILTHFPFHSLLDVGCGDGRLIYELGKRFPGKKLMGTDYSARSISFARAFNPGAEFLVGDIGKSRITQGKFDVITAIEVLEHIKPEESSLFLENIASYLERDGTLVLTVPSINTPLIAKHYRHFEKDKLLGILKPQFNIRELHFLNRIGWKDRFIKRLFDNGLFALRQKRFSNFLYNYYSENLLIASESDAKRICVVATKK